MGKKLTNNGSSTSSITVGLDIGYGVVKAVAGEQKILFPSVWGFARDIRFQADDITAKYPGDQISDDDGDWFVGDLAQSQLRPGELRRLIGRTADEENIGHVMRARLAKVALGKLMPGRMNGEAVHVRIATGLPVDHMPGAADLKKALLGQFAVKTDITDMVANITEVMVMPQPYGTIYRHMLTEKGTLNTCHTFKRTAVIDVGTYSIDLATDDDGEYIDSLSGSIEAGMFTAQEYIAQMYEARFGQKPNYRDVETILRNGCVRVKGDLLDFTEDRHRAIAPVIAATINLLNQVLGAAANIDVIYIVGGGAPLVATSVLSAYPQAKLVEAAQTSNAEGYLYYALFSAQP
jgi:hypothetical protein